MFDHFGRTMVRVEHVLEDLKPPRELTIQNPVYAMCVRKGPSFVLHPCPEVGRRKLVLHLSHARDVRVSEQKPDHGVGKGTTHEVVNHQAHCKLPTRYLKQRHLGWSSLVGAIVPQERSESSV
jgi:hypothetical protein